jgi:hypothetical protein
MPYDSGTLEDLVAEVRAGATAHAPFDLWAAGVLTLGGSPVPRDEAMAVIGDAVLAVGLGPGGFTDGPGGQTYHFKPWD